MTERNKAPARGGSCFFWLIVGLFILLALGLAALALGILTGAPPQAHSLWLV